MRSRPVRDARLLPLLLLPLILSGSAGCGDVKSPTEPPGNGGGPAFTFARIQAEIFTPGCATAGCHTAAAGVEGLVLEAGRSYGQIVNRPANQNRQLDRVEPGDPERSYLVKKLRGDPDITGARMPLDRGALTAEQIAGIVEWVRAGAPDN